MAITVVANKGAVPKVVGAILGHMRGFKDPYPQVSTTTFNIVGSGLVPKIQRGMKEPYPQMSISSGVVVPGGLHITPVKPLPGTGGGGGGGGTVGYGI